MNGTVTIDKGLYGVLLNMLHRDADNGMGARAEIIDDLNESVSQHENDIATLRAERDTLAAKVAELERQEPVAWMHDKEGRVDTCHDSVKKLWLKVGQKQNTQFMREIVPCRVEHYNIPLYTRPIPAAPTVLYTPGNWYMAKSREEIQAFYLSRLPAIREAAHSLGYAIGLHGSTRRDMDLIAVPWRDGFADKDVLAQAIAIAACGIARDGGRYVWEEKPAGRVATSFAICWTPFPEIAGSGCIDLSVVAPAQPAVPAGASLATPEAIARAANWYAPAPAVSEECPNCKKAWAMLPIAWYRKRSDGGIDGPLMDDDSRMCATRRKEWNPLYERPFYPDFLNYRQGFNDGIEEIRYEVKQLCKDFSDLQNRPYMGDVYAQVDAICERALLQSASVVPAPDVPEECLELVRNIADSYYCNGEHTPEESCPVCAATSIINRSISFECTACKQNVSSFCPGDHSGCPNDWSSALLQSAPQASTSGVQLPTGWAITRCDADTLTVTHDQKGGTVVKRQPTDDRTIPEAVLFALAEDLLEDSR